MAEPAVSFLLENVSQLLEYHGSLISGAEYELRQLTMDLDLLKAYLRDWAMKPKEEEALGNFKRQLKEVVYELEDTIDSYLTYEAAPKNINFSLQRLGEIHLMAERVKDLRIRHMEPLLDSYIFEVMFPYSGPSTMEHPHSHTALKKVNQLQQLTDSLLIFAIFKKTFKNF